MSILEKSLKPEHITAGNTQLNFAFVRPEPLLKLTLRVLFLTNWEVLFLMSEVPLYTLTPTPYTAGGQGNSLNPKPRPQVAMLFSEAPCLEP